MFWLILFVKLAVVGAAVAEVSCPVQCQCMLNIKRIDCSSRNITYRDLVQMKFPPQYLLLDLSNNQLTALPPKAHFTNTSFTAVVLTGNKLTSVPDLPDTVLLAYLNKNMISGYLSTSNFTTWAETANLIYLSNNNIDGIHENAFAPCSGLKLLDLKWNHIQDIQKESFSNLSSLTYLSLAGNKISNLEPGVFDEMPKLETLLISSNKLEVIPANVFTKLPQKIHLNNNQIRQIAIGSFGGKDVDIELRNNNLNTISAEWFVNFNTQQNGSLNVFKNKLSCSCELLTNISAFKNIKLEGQCKDHSEKGYKDLAKLRLQEPSNCTKCDFVWCRNNGVCAGDSHSFSCACTSGFKGDECEYLKMPCDYKPCRNKATCTNLLTNASMPNAFSCECARGYKGKICSDVDPCYKDGANVCNSAGSLSLSLIAQFYVFVVIAKLLFDFA